MAQHPRFARAWAQKLCQFANSFSCRADDPELVRVADAFRASGFSFKLLVRELFSSPLVTQPAPTATTLELGSILSVSRRDHFCAALENRLGLPDACDLRSAEPTAIQNLAFGIPGAGYTRGASRPLLPRDSNLFFSAAVEGLCGRLADRVVDRAECPQGGACFESAAVERALVELVRGVIGLPESDPRYPDVQQIMRAHYDDATGEGYAPQLGTNGRHHWADHHVSVVIGSPMRAGVIGGVVPGSSQDYTALPIDSKSGIGAAAGDIPVDETLGAFGKTLGRALGVPEQVLEQEIGDGKVIAGALA